MAIGIGDVYVNVIPNMDAFTAEVEAGVGEAAAVTEEELSTATATGMETGATEGSAAVAENKGILGNFKHMAELAGGFIAYEFIKKSVDAFDTYDASVKQLAEILHRSGLSKELPSLQQWTQDFSNSTGIAQVDLLKLERQLTTAGLTGSKRVQDITNAVEGLSQETGKSVSMFTRSLIPSILNVPTAAISQLQKWKVFSDQQLAAAKALADTTDTSVKSLMAATGVSQKYAEAVHGMTEKQKMATLKQVELNAVMHKGMDAFQSTALERFHTWLQNIEIEVGKKVMPIIDKFLEFIMHQGPRAIKAFGAAFATVRAFLIEHFEPVIRLIIKRIKEFWPVIKEVATILATALIGALAGAIILLTDLAKILLKAKGPMKYVEEAILGIVAAYVLWIAVTKLWELAQDAAIAVQLAFNTIATMNPIGLIALAIAGLAVLIIMNWGKVKAFLIPLWASIKKLGAAVWDFIKAHWKLLVVVLTGGLALIVGLFIKHFQGIKKIVITVWHAIEDVFKFAVRVITDVFSPLITVFKVIFGAIATIIELTLIVYAKLVVAAWNAVKGPLGAVFRFIGKVAMAVWHAIEAGLKILVKLFIAEFKIIAKVASVVWNVIKTVVISVWNAIKVAWSAAVGFFSGVWDKIKGPVTAVWNGIKGVIVGVWKAIKSAWGVAVGFFKGVWGGIVGAVKTALNGIIQIWDDTIGKIAHGQTINAGPLHATLPDLFVPQMAEGGIVTKPTLALIGEAGPEAVVPLSGSHARPKGMTTAALGRDRVEMTIADWERGTGYMRWLANDEHANDRNLRERTK